MGQGLLPFRFEAAPRPMDLTAHAGLALIAETLLALGVDALVRDGLRLHARRRGYAEFDKLQAIVLVQAAGGDCVEDVRVLARDIGMYAPGETVVKIVGLPPRPQSYAVGDLLHLRRPEPTGNVQVKEAALGAVAAVMLVAIFVSFAAGRKANGPSRR